MRQPRDEIAALVYRYAELLDQGNLDGVAALFEHATWGSGTRDRTHAGHRPGPSDVRRGDPVRRRDAPHEARDHERGDRPRRTEVPTRRPARTSRCCKRTRAYCSRSSLGVTTIGSRTSTASGVSLSASSIRTCRAICRTTCGARHGESIVCGHDGRGGSPGAEGALDGAVEGAVRGGHRQRAVHRLCRLRHRLPPRRDRLRRQERRLQAVPPRGRARPDRLHARREGLHLVHAGVPPLPRLGARGRRAPVRPGAPARTSRRASTKDILLDPGRRRHSPPDRTGRRARLAPCSSGCWTTTTSTARSPRTSRATSGEWKAIPGVAATKEEVLERRRQPLHVLGQHDGRVRGP